LFALNVNGQNVTNLNATNISSGTLSPARLPSGGSWPLTSALNIDSNAFVIDPVNNRIGVGTTTPTHTVHIASTAPTLAIQDTDSTTDQVGYVSYRDSGNVERAWVGYGTAGSQVFSIVNARPAGHIALLPLAGGNVGIGTTTPQRTLSVNGSAEITGGDFFIVDVSNTAFLSPVAFEDPVDFHARVLIGPNVATGGINLVVNGSAAKPGGGSWTAFSDRRLKRNIQPLQNSLEQLLALRGVNYEFIDPSLIGERAGPRIGMIAQEVEDVFPDWVDELDNGYKSLTFRGFEALTVEALRDLRHEKDAEIDSLRSEKDAQIASLQHDNQQLQDRLDALEAAVARLDDRKEIR
jgi:hypothetical protein